MIAAENAYTTTMDEDEGLRMCIKDVLVANKSMLAREDVKDFLAQRPELIHEILIKVVQ
jgi:hypothetical protein